MATFNSQPHTRLTFWAEIPRVIFHLSIHSLIRGWPISRRVTHPHWHLSIHSLIRGWPFPISASCKSWSLSIHSLIRGWPLFGVFLQVMNYPFNSQPHTRLTVWRSVSFIIWIPFNSQPHTRLTRNILISRLINGLSIHSLIRGWPDMKEAIPAKNFFQFTASYEADQATGHYIIRVSIFQFTASYEADRVEEEEEGVSFNSQPHTRLTK